MLPSPRDVVVGASALEPLAEFLEVFGFARGAAAPLPAPAARALYGLEGDGEELVMHVPGAAGGRVRLVATPHPPRRFAPFDPRPFAIDLFSTDVDRSVEAASAAGAHLSPITEHRMGPVVIREVEVIGPDQLVVTLLQPSVGRRSSILDRDPDRLHSEVHAFVWNDSDLDRLLPFWTGCGLAKVTDVVLDTPGLGALVGVPDEEVAMRLTVLADDEGRPIRVELVDFLGKGGVAQPTLPLAAGLHAPAFVVEDLAATLAEMPGVEIGEQVALDTPVHPAARTVSVCAPGGHRFELWQEG